MTRKDYTAMAAALRNVKPRDDSHAAVRGWKEAVHATADVFAADNPRFDRDRYLVACDCH